MSYPGSARPDLYSIRTADGQDERAEAVRGGFGDDGYALGGDDPPAPLTSGIDRAIRLSTAVAVLAVAGIVAYVSYWHAYAVVRAHGESGITARLEPATIDGLVYASSMVVLSAARHRVPVPSLARWLLGLGIAATLTANMAQGWSHGLVGAVVAAWPAVSLVGSYELSLGVSRLLHDGALKRFMECLCNTSAMCGARCRRCSEACPPRTCNMCNTLDRRRRRTYHTATCTFRRVAQYARFAPRENELLVWLIRTSGTAERRPPAGHLHEYAACHAAAPSARTAAVGTGFPRRGERDAPDQARQPAAQVDRPPPTSAASEHCDQAVPQADAVHDAAVAAYRLSIQAGNPLSERKLAQMFGRTSRRWARARIADARRAPSSGLTGGSPSPPNPRSSPLRDPSGCSI
jgi:hypothetical protein